MNNKEQQINLKGRIDGSSAEARVEKPDFEADLRGFQKPQLGKSKKKIILGAIIGLGVIIIGAVVVLATGLWNPVWNPFQSKSSPDEILTEAFENTIALKTVHSKTVFDVNLEGEENFSMKIESEEDYDATDKLNPKSQSTIDMDIFVEGVNMFFDSEIRSLDEILYVKIGTVPLPISLGLSSEGIDVDDWTNKWFRLDFKELGMSLGKTLSEEGQVKIEEELKELLSEHPLAKVVEELTSEKIEGQDTYHYLLSIDKENLKVFLAGLMEMLGKYSGLVDLKQNNEEISNDVDEAFEKIGGIDFEIWIGKKDKLIYKVAGQKSFDLSDLEPEEERTLSLNFDMSFSKFNEPVEILAPDDSQSIIEMLMPFIQMFTGGTGGTGGADIFGLGGAADKAKDSRIKSALNQARVQAELLWMNSEGGSYKELCYYGGLNVNHLDYGFQLKTISDDVMSQGSILTCYSSKDNYCISASLLKGGFFCVDSAGRAQDSTGNINPCTQLLECNF